MTTRRRSRGPLRSGVRRAGWIALISSALLSLASCSAKSRHKVLSVFVDGSGKPPPPTRAVRRDLVREIERLERELDAARRQAQAAREEAAEPEEVLPIETVADWPEALELLPRDAAGRVDWSLALAHGTIRPRPGVEPDAARLAVFELEATLGSATPPIYRVTFSHAAHTEWLACVSCHPANDWQAPAVAGGDEMARIRAGESCGVCHGRVAFGIDACARCHDGIPPAPKPVAEAPRTPVEAASNWYEASRLLPAAGERPDWDRALADGVIAPRAGLDPGAEAEEVLPLDVEMVPDGDEELKVVFSHETHTEWLTCDNCHDEIFEAEAGAATVTMETIEEGKHCGACHGSVAFAADDIETCGRCHPGLGA